MARRYLPGLAAIAGALALSGCVAYPGYPYAYNGVAVAPGYVAPGYVAPAPAYAAPGYVASAPPAYVESNVYAGGYGYAPVAGALVIGGGGYGYGRGWGGGWGGRGWGGGWGGRGGGWGGGWGGRH